MLLCNGRGYNRLQTGSHIHIGMYTKCFGTLVCCVWAYGATLTVIPPLQVGGGIWDYVGRPEPVICCDAIVEATTGFRLDPTSILDVYKMFWHLDMLCSMGAYGTTLTAVPLCRSRVDFGVLGGRPEPV